MAIEVTSVHERRPARIIKGVGRAVRWRGARADHLRKRRNILRSLTIFALLILSAATAFLIYSYISYSKIVDARLAHGYLTSRAGIYAAPRVLRTGQTLSQETAVALLRRAGYLESEASDVWSGSFSASQANAVEIHPRRVSSGSAPSVVRIGFDKRNRIAEITGDGARLDAYSLEPEVLTTDTSMKTGKRAALSYSDIPPVVAHAILSIEDHRFFEHSGLDLFGIGRALLRNAGDNEVGQGGSTITQQLVKNTYLSPVRTFRRKFAEAMIAFTLERRLSKEDIFALYCNEIYLGQRGAVSVRGVGQAARVFFGKELKDLSLSEAATIAGMIQSPNRYAPDRHMEAALARRNTVLGVMARDRFITTEEAGIAAQEPLKIAPGAEGDDSLAPYFIDHVNRVVEWQLEASGRADERGLRIYTTIDLDLQQLAEAAVKRQLERLDKIYRGKQGAPQAALVALDPRTGDVLAMVGGRSYGDSQLNRATDAQRQPGSVFKPFVYAAALESGISPLSMYRDAPREFSYDRRAVYRPANYGGGYSMQDVTMRTALVKSLNVVTVDVATRTGLERVAQLAQTFGLPKPEPYPALALGTTEATPLKLAAAYTAFANLGQRVEPRVIAHATTAGGDDVLGEARQARQVVKPTTAYMITDMLRDVIDHGTARAARGAVKRTAIAGKTGTSRDGWFVGYTPNLVCAVWIGFDDNKQLGLTGAEAALPAWTDFVSDAVTLRPDLGGESFERPAGITIIEIDPETGLRATASCPQRERIAVASNFVTTYECYKHNELYDPLAAVDADQFYDETASIPAEQTRTRAGSELYINRRQQPPPRAITSQSLTQFSSPAATRVETNAQGRRTLTNEMRLRSSSRP
ncbi:MAG: PBP1A family penicillin-binding protein [Pyrinomonadaceae bacterium]